MVDKVFSEIGFYVMGVMIAHAVALSAPLPFALCFAPAVSLALAAALALALPFALFFALPVAIPFALSLPFALSFAPRRGMRAVSLCWCHKM